MILISGILLNGCVCGALFCPPESWNIRKPIKEWTVGEDGKCRYDGATRIDKKTTDPNKTVQGFDKPCKGLKKLFDLDLLKDSKQWVLIIHEIVWNTGSFIWWMFLVDHAGSIGLSGPEAAVTVSITTGCSALIRVIIAGVMVTWPAVDPLHIVTFSGVSAGLCSVILPVCVNKSLFMTICAVCGVCIGLFNAALGVFVVRMYGVEKCTGAYSYLLVGSGIGALFGPPIGGKSILIYLIKYLD